jgi:ABC-type uncharacterized transport system substrate-binding protein
MKLIAMFLFGVLVGFPLALVVNKRPDVVTVDQLADFVEHNSTYACAQGITEAITYLYGSSPQPPDCALIGKDRGDQYRSSK